MDNSNVIEGTLAQPSNLSLAGVVQIPAVRQLLLLIGVAVAVAAGFYIASWSQTPGYTQLYGDLQASEAAEIVDALRAADIDYKLNANSGNILVPQDALHTARLQLASQGLPGSAATGMQSLGDQSSFGTSQFMETARYQHALEAELARTISSLGSVREARVHLALPKQSSFIRDQKVASASVLLHLYRGRSLESDQAAAVVNLVAASVPNLQTKEVTLVDQYGSLLSSSGQAPVDAQATSQFKYARRLEETFKHRIEDLLTPIIGASRIRAEVVADIDFTYVEETRESFDPNRTVVRSEQINEDLRTGQSNVSAGIPGALSNQPPEVVGDAGDVAEAGPPVEEKNTSRSSVRNYEVDRTISHTRPTSGNIRRLSVAVLVDESPIGDEAEGEADAAAGGLTETDIERYTALVKEAVGFNEARGDTVVVMGQAFLKPDIGEAAEPPPFWEKPVLRDTLKQVLGAALVLAIAFGIVRPMLRGVMASSAPATLSGEYLGSGQGYPMPAAAGQFASGGGQIPAPSYNEKVAAAKNITGHDPGRVAELVKKWVATDE
jgi:flagellar M-ring protein FliF